MGNQQGKAKTKKSVFMWEKIKTKYNTSLQFDPRFEDIYINNNKLFITDINDNIFIFNSVKDKHNHHKNYEYSNLIKINYKRNIKKNPIRVQKKFDIDGTSLLWIEKIGYIVYYFNLATQNFIEYDLYNFLQRKYGNNSNCNFRIATKSLINLGNGLILFMVFLNNKSKNNNNNGGNKSYWIDIIKLDIITKQEIQTITVHKNDGNSFNITGLDLDIFDIAGWGFQKCPNKNQCIILTRQFSSSSRNYSYLFLISLINGKILYNATYNWIRDLMFNNNGNFLCIFEKIKQTKRSFHGNINRFVNIIIFNVNKLDNICKLSMNYGKKHLSWDSIVWINNSLLFVKPYQFNIVNPNDKAMLSYNDSFNGNNSTDEKESQNNQISINKPNMSPTTDTNSTITPSFKPDSSNNNNNNNNSTHKYSRYDTDDDEKKLCLLSLDTKWWDIYNNKEIINILESKHNLDINLCHIILEYSGLKWVFIEFDYYSKIEKKQKIFKSSMNEIFRTGTTKNENILLSGQLMFNIKNLKSTNNDVKNRINNWEFKCCVVPKKFTDITHLPDINISVL